jgi:hypothetical protein
MSAVDGGGHCLMPELCIEADETFFQQLLMPVPATTAG